MDQQQHQYPPDGNPIRGLVIALTAVGLLYVIGATVVWLVTHG